MANRQLDLEVDEGMCETTDVQRGKLSSGSLKRNKSIVQRGKLSSKEQKRCFSDYLSIQIPIFLPFGPLLCCWNSFLLMMLLYSIVVIPYSIAFEIIPYCSDPIAIIGFIIDLCLLFDIILNFRTAYIDQYDRLRIIHDPKLIAKRYVTRWFIIDLLSSFPSLFLILSTSPNDTDIASAVITLQYIRLLRVIKFLRLIKYIFHEVTHSMYHLNRGQRTVLQLMKIIGSMLLIAHFFACIWYSIGDYAYRHNHPSWIDTIIEYHDFNEGNFTKYSYSFYWAIVTLFTTGYGDIHANNIYEQWFASVGIIFGSCLFAYFIGVLTNGLNEDLNHRNASERVEKSLVFCTHYNLPQQLRTAVISHIKYFNKYNYAFNHEYIMKSLPNYLQKEIEKHAKRSRLRDLDIFKSFPDEITGQIALKLRSKSCGVGKILYTKGDIATQLFIQRTGKSELIHNNGSIRQIKRGDVIGEDAILYRERVDTVQCSTWSEFYILNIEDILSVLNHNYNRYNAKQKWCVIQNIVKGPMPSQYSATATDTYCRHFVRFNTVKEFEEYVPMEAREMGLAKNVISIQTQKNAKYEEYERKIEKENEAEEKKSKKKKDAHKSMDYVLNMFGNAMERENSDLRNVKVVENHNKNQRSPVYEHHDSLSQSNPYCSQSPICSQYSDNDDRIIKEVCVLLEGAEMDSTDSDNENNYNIQNEISFKHETITKSVSNIVETVS